MVLRSCALVVVFSISLPAQSDPGAVARADAAFAAGEWPKAAALYRAVVAADQQDGRAWFRLGHALHAQQKWAAALSAFKRAAGFAGYAVKASYNAGCAHARRGEADAAIEWLGKAVDAGFKDGQLVRTDADLQSLRADPRYQKLIARLPVQIWPDDPINVIKPSDKEFIALPQAQKFAFMRTQTQKPWKIRNTFISPRGKMQTDAKQTGGIHLGGKVIIDHYAGDHWDGSFLAGMTIRAFDAESDTWQLVWLDDKNTPRFRPMVGRFVAGVGYFYPRGTTATTASNRFRWDNLSTTSARWMQQSRRMTAAGPKWVASWVMDFSH